MDRAKPIDCIVDVGDKIWLQIGRYLDVKRHFLKNVPPQRLTDANAANDAEKRSNIQDDDASCYRKQH
jgi:hypothetical protein